MTLDSNSSSRRSIYEKHIVVLEDDQWNALLLKTLLQKRVTKLSIFDNPEDGLNFIQYEAMNIDMIITDINMPQLSGIDVLNLLKSSKYKFPIIAITAQTSVGSKIRETDYFDDIINKPYTEQDLDFVLQKYLDTPEQLKNQTIVKSDHDENKPTFNFEKIKEFVGNDNVLLKELISELISSNRENLCEFKHSIRNNNPKQLADISHKMIQTYENLNLAYIAESLRTIEVYYELKKQKEMFDTARTLLILIEDVSDGLDKIKPQYYT
jgi:DNA-binding response OmpR family regulator